MPLPRHAIAPPPWGEGDATARQTGQKIDPLSRMFILHDVKNFPCDCQATLISASEGLRCSEALCQSFLSMCRW
ncbi:MAG: hypothetical protein ACK58T_38430, partial [Phycisphaerae bacterium]